MLHCNSQMSFSSALSSQSDFSGCCRVSVKLAGRHTCTISECLMPLDEGLLRINLMHQNTLLVKSLHA